MYGLSGFSDKLKIQNCENSKGNFVHEMYGMFGIMEKLNVKSFVNSERNCVQ